MSSDDRFSSKYLARRVAVLGGIAAVCFAVLLFRVWFLQVLSGDEYLAEANDNRTRTVIASAPRGEIRDRNGEVLVGNRASLALQLDPQRLPEDEDERREQLARVAEVAGMKLARVRKEIKDQLELVPGGIVTLKRDIGHNLVYYVAENQAQVPALSVSRVFVRRYTGLADIAPHILGYVREVTAEDLETSRFRNLQPGDTVGREGLEDTYDEYLRGRPGETRIQVDALGRSKGQLASKPPVPGGNLRLALDGELQQAGDAALAGRNGAYVAMNVNTGEVLAMGSNPRYDPSVYTRPIPDALWDQLNSDELGAPLVNRATASYYPTGSTFKPITALAALDAGIINPNTIVHDNGFIQVGDQKFTNAGEEVYGPINMIDSLRVSSDVYYYRLGQKMNGTLQLQNWAKRLGFGSATGIDLPAEAEGLVPTPEWRNELAKEVEWQIPWSVGHNIQFAIGQGDQQADPLQVAVAYAAIGNGGTVVTPHLGLAVEDAAGRIMREFEPPPRRHVEIDKGHLRVVMEGLHQAAQSPAGGTAASVFGDFPIAIAGKTGTAERGGDNPDQAWFAALAPYEDPEIVVVATIEGGGWGAEAAAPAVRTILDQYFADEIAEANEPETEAVSSVESEG